MGIFRQFPYSNFHEMNMDEIIKIVKETVDSWSEYYTTWDTWKNDITVQMQNLYEWFENLDVSEEINAKLDEMAENGGLMAMIAPYLPFVTPEMFGAVGDGVTDDTEAFSRCIANGKYIICKENANYHITSTISILKPVTIDFNHASITCTTRHLFWNFESAEIVTGYNGHGNISLVNGIVYGGGCSFAHAENIVINNMQFYNCINDHIIELCASKNVTITNSIFKGMRTDIRTAKEYINIDPCVQANFPWFDNIDSYDLTSCENIVVENCFFTIGDELLYSFGEFAFGCHSNGIEGAPNHKYIKFTNNTVIHMTNYCLRLNCFDYCIIKDNTFIYDSSYAIQFGSWVVMDKLTITNNEFINDNATTQGYVFLVRNAGVDGLSIYDNIVTKIKTATTKQVRNYYFDILDTTTWNLIKVDPEIIPNISSAPMPITSYNRIRINLGSVSGNANYITNIIDAYATRNFVVNEKFPFLKDNNGTPAFGLLTITSNHAITSSDTLNHMYIYKDDTPYE